jgi:hypothetical protein
MKTLVIHGVYESSTLRTLKALGVKEFSFDLRVRSQNFIPLKDLLQLAGEIPQGDRIFLTFENDRPETIISSLDLLKKVPHTFLPLFRDDRTASFYKELNKVFYWMFQPQSDWRNILKLDNLRGVFLPLSYQSFYETNSELWDLVDRKGLEVYLHSDNFEQSLFTSSLKDVKLSIDLTAEIEVQYRSVDQLKLKKMKIWSKLNEDFTGQR